MQSGEYDEDIDFNKKIPLDVLSQALIEQEALLCNRQGLKAGSIILEAYLMLERDHE